MSGDLTNAHRGLDDIPAAAAAMEGPADLDPSNGDYAEKLIRLYCVTSAPVKAARALRFTVRVTITLSDCYIDILSPAKFCDPWADYAAKSHIENNPELAFNANQSKIIQVLKDYGDVEVPFLKG